MSGQVDPGGLRPPHRLLGAGVVGALAGGGLALVLVGQALRAPDLVGAGAVAVAAGLGHRVAAEQAAGRLGLVPAMARVLALLAAAAWLPAPAEAASLALAGIGLIAVGLGVALRDLVQLTLRDPPLGAGPLVAQQRALVTALILAGLGLAVHPWWAGSSLIRVLLWTGLLGLLGLEAAVGALVSAVRNRPAPVAPLLLRALFERESPWASLIGLAEQALGLDLARAWALVVLRRSLAPLALLGLGVAEGLTAFTVVESGEVGWVERGGALIGPELPPGLHLHPPWPLGRVRKVDVARVSSLALGYQNPRPGRASLWTVSHALSESALLLGDGRELLAFNAQLHWRVADARRYLTAASDPEQQLAAEAWRVLTRTAAGVRLEETLSEGLGAFADRLEEDIASAAERLGIEVVDLTLFGLHPPVDVAQDYQAVVAAQLDQQTQVTEARAYAARTVAAAQAEALTRLRAAAGEAARRRAQGQAARAPLVALGPLGPALPAYLALRQEQARRQALDGRPLVVVDHRYESEGGQLWLDR